MAEKKAMIKEVELNDEKIEEHKEIVCPACLGEKTWPFADMAYGAPCPICRGVGQVTMKLAMERGW